MSELIGIETGSLSGIESGRCFPSLVTLEKIAKVLNVELKTFFEFEASVTIKEMKEIIRSNLNKIEESQIQYIYNYFDGYKE